jgi:hypothetical protein
MRMQRWSVAGLVIVLAAGAPRPAAAQDVPLAPPKASGQTVSPVFEGWYRNPDGSFSLSFGYFNRNSAEALDIPLGPNNYMQPAPADRGQPTHFTPRRHWGVFAVTVPANFGTERKVTWTLVVRGDTLSVPGSLKRGWEIDALEGEVGSGNTPPRIRFDSGGKGGAGPGGIAAGPLTVAAGSPLTLAVWVSDEPTGRGRATAAGTAARAGGAGAGTGRAAGRGGSPLTLTWFKYRGPGTVAFGDATPDIDRATGRATTTATFSEPGEYVVRVRANDSAVASAGHAQCCWTNGFVRVTVTR